MGELVNLDDHRPVEEIATLVLARSADGRFLIYPIGADEDWIATQPNVAARFRDLRRMTGDALPFLEECAVEHEQ
jgi:hypothetical protein